MASESSLTETISETISDTISETISEPITYEEKLAYYLHYEDYENALKYACASKNTKIIDELLKHHHVNYHSGLHGSILSGDMDLVISFLEKSKNVTECIGVVDNNENRYRKEKCRLCVKLGIKYDDMYGFVDENIGSDIFKYLFLSDNEDIIRTVMEHCCIKLIKAMKEYKIINFKTPITNAFYKVFSKTKMFLLLDSNKKLKLTFHSGNDAEIMSYVTDNNIPVKDIKTAIPVLVRTCNEPIIIKITEKYDINIYDKYICMDILHGKIHTFRDSEYLQNYIEKCRHHEYGDYCDSMLVNEYVIFRIKNNIEVDHKKWMKNISFYYNEPEFHVMIVAYLVYGKNKAKKIEGIKSLLAALYSNEEYRDNISDYILKAGKLQNFGGQARAFGENVLDLRYHLMDELYDVYLWLRKRYFLPKNAEFELMFHGKDGNGSRPLFKIWHGVDQNLITEYEKGLSKQNIVNNKSDLSLISLLNYQ